VRSLYADEHSFLLDCLMEGFNNVPILPLHKVVLAMRTIPTM